MTPWARTALAQRRWSARRRNPAKDRFMTRDPSQPRSSDIAKLLELMRKLRDPANGCPWDVEQTFASIAPYTVEEAYEVAYAIDRNDMESLREELGDLVLQVVFHAQMASESGDFAFGDVVEAICDKLVRRHPHVFGNAGTMSPAAVKESWDAIKQQERRAKQDRQSNGASILDDVPGALPALSRAVKLQARAAEVGFDWPDSRLVIDKLNEEMLELSAELLGPAVPERIEEELGDLLFVYANLARHLNVDPEQALRKANGKFIRRFKAIEEALEKSGETLEAASLDTMDALWSAAKHAEKNSS